MSCELKIATVVVTYNRLKLLKECIDSLRNQTRKIDGIFVVNNSSTDGTEEWLSNQNDLTTITQPNSGGAGGFYTGMKTAYERGYDWIWVMDDDGLPKNNALFELICKGVQYKGVLNSVVVTKNNENELNFGIEDFEENIFYTNFDEIKKKSHVAGANFFNGTFIQKEVILQIGFPNPNFFIYGDDIEYYFRIKEAGISIKTILTSFMYHPNQKHTYVGKGRFFYKLSKINSFAAKYFPRNIVIIYYLYDEYSLRRLIKTFGFDLFGLVFLQKSIKNTFIYIRSIISGVLIVINPKRRKYFINA